MNTCIVYGPKGIFEVHFVPSPAWTESGYYLAAGPGCEGPISVQMARRMPTFGGLDIGLKCPIGWKVDFKSTLIRLLRDDLLKWFSTELMNTSR